MMMIELWFWWERKLWQYLINDTQQHSLVHRYKKELWWGVIYAHTYAHTHADNILNINLDNKSTIKSKRFPYGPCYVQNSISERCGLYKGTTVWFMQRPCKSSVEQNQHPVLFFTLSLSKETYWLGDTEERLDFFSPRFCLSDQLACIIVCEFLWSVAENKAWELSVVAYVSLGQRSTQILACICVCGMTV